MRSFLLRNWKLLGAAASFAWSLKDAILWMLDWRGRYDAAIQSYADIGGWEAMIGIVLSPPPWFPLASAVFGVALIYWHRQQQGAATTSVSLPIGTIQYESFIPTIRINHVTNNNSLQMKVILKNNSSLCLAFDAFLLGKSSGKITNQPRFSGFINSKSDIILVSDTIYDIDVDRHLDPKTPTFSGDLFYDLKYWPAGASDQTRRTARNVHFEAWHRIQDRNNENAGTTTYTEHKITTIFSNEIEE